MDIRVNPQKLTEELISAGLPVQSVDSNGKVIFTATLSKAQQAQADEVVARHDPRPPAYALRWETLSRHGIAAERLLLALLDQAAFNDGVELERILDEVAWN